MKVPRTGFSYFDAPREQGCVLALAHRGGALHPDLVGYENTMRAFRSAVDLGYRYLETDVQVSADDVVVAFHDDDLSRVTDREGLVSELPSAEIARALIAGSEPVPTMAGLLEEFPTTRFNIDLKTPRAVEPMVRLLARTGAYDRVCIGSFNEHTLRRFRRACPVPVATTCGVAAVVALALLPKGDLIAPLLRDRGGALQVPHYRHGLRVVDADLLRRAHASRRHVHVWTVDDRAEMEHLLDLGVDGLITDRTDVLRDVLTERGIWEGCP